MVNRISPDKTRIVKLTKPNCRERGCPMQGQPHERCKAHRSGTVQAGAPEPCMIWPMKDQFVCNIHGGTSGAGKAHVRKAITAARKLVAFNPDDSETPEEGLLREVLWSSQVARALGEAVAQIEDDRKNDGGLPQWGRDSKQLNVLIKAGQDERQLHARLCKLALDAGIAQRQMDILEAQAGAMVQAMITLLTAPALRLDSQQITEGKILAAEIMRGMSRGKVTSEVMTVEARATEIGQGSGD